MSPGRIYNVTHTEERGQVVSFQLINTVSSVRVFKLIFLTIDNRSQLVSTQSATLYLPKKISFNEIIAHKHPTFLVVGDSQLGHEIYLNSAPENTAIQIAKSGRVVVEPDGVGMGESYGTQLYLDHVSETYSVVDAIRAVRNLNVSKNSLFVYKFQRNIYVTVMGYSLGGLFASGVAHELMTNIPEQSRFRIKRVILGAVPNPKQVIQNIANGIPLAPNMGKTVLPIGFVYLILLYLAGRPELAMRILRNHVFRNVLPLFKDVHGEHLKNQEFISKMTQALLSSTTEVMKIVTTPPTIGIQELTMQQITQTPFSNATTGSTTTSTTNPFTPIYSTANGLPYAFDSRVIFDLSSLKYLDLTDESSNFTNRCLTFTSLSNVPMSFIYSSNDELVMNGATQSYNDASAAAGLPPSPTWNWNDTSNGYDLLKMFGKQPEHIVRLTIDNSISDSQLANTVLLSDASNFIKIKVNSTSNHNAFFGRWSDIAKNIITSIPSAVVVD